MSKKQSKKAAPKAASPAPKTKRTPRAKPAVGGLVDLSTVQLAPSGRTSAFEQPAKDLLAAYDSGNKTAAVSFDLQGKKTARTYLYNAMHKQLRQLTDGKRDFKVSVRDSVDGKTAYISIAEVE